MTTQQPTERFTADDFLGERLPEESNSIYFSKEDAEILNIGLIQAAATERDGRPCDIEKIAELEILNKEIVPRLSKLRAALTAEQKKVAVLAIELDRIESILENDFDKYLSDCRLASRNLAMRRGDELAEALTATQQKCERLERMPECVRLVIGVIEDEDCFFCDDDESNKTILPAGQHHDGCYIAAVKQHYTTPPAPASEGAREDEK